MTEAAFWELTEELDLIFILIGAAILLIEIVEALIKRSATKKTVLEALVSTSTQIPSVAVETFMLTGAYAIYYMLAQTVVTWSIPITMGTALLAILIADFTYYWEHRIAHEVRLLWTQHAVHHSSRDMNIITAIRFGPFEGVWAVIIHLPMVMMGFSPDVIIGSSIIVLAYQTWLHTEVIGKLGPLEWVLNTPSHHRVHHGCDDKYLDKNYAGILIIWDRMFGTFQEEEETPRYGLKRDFNSQNPIKVWFSEIPGLVRDLAGAKSPLEAWGYLFRAPGWEPDRK
ncbi:MAG: sterol desaturase family protein [Pseudomonadota bacterium]